MKKTDLERVSPQKLSLSQMKLIKFALAIAILKTNVTPQDFVFHKQIQIKQKIEWWQDMFLKRILTSHKGRSFSTLANNFSIAQVPIIHQPVSLLQQSTFQELEAFALSGLDVEKHESKYAQIMQKIKSTTWVEDEGYSRQGEEIETFSRFLLHQVIFNAKQNLDEGNQIVQNVVKVLSNLSKDADLSPLILNAFVSTLFKMLEQISSSHSSKIWITEISILERMHPVFVGLETVLNAQISYLRSSQNLKRPRKPHPTNGTSDLMEKLALLLNKSRDFKLAQCYCWRLISNLKGRLLRNC